MLPCADQGACVKVPVFDGDRCAPAGPVRECRRVTIENPCCPGQWAEVTLGVDDCGNLMVCVHRAPERCGCRPRCDRPPHCDRPPRPRPRCLPEGRRDCEKGRLYGSWS